MQHVTEPMIVSHHGMHLIHTKQGESWWQYAFNPERDAVERLPGVPFPNFQVAVAGRPHGFCQAMLSGFTEMPGQMVMRVFERTEGVLRYEYFHEETRLAIIVTMELIPGAAVMRVTTEAVNESSEVVVLTHLSSAYMHGIASDGLLDWHDPSKIRVHYCRQTWEGEGQWRQGTLEELGVYPASVHPESTAFQIASVGSQSTSRYWPIIIVEDLETKKAWYLQVETSSGWHIELSRRGSWDGSGGSLFLHAGAASERQLGWTCALNAGERCTTVPVAMGCVNGGFQEAIRELTRYRRSVLKPAPAWSGYCPVLFNDYMNALWGNPSEKGLLPLIDAAATAGADVFCIDAGWFSEADASWGNKLGEWRPSQNRFGEKGLQGVLDAIKAKGMVPGLWLEMEVCGDDTDIAVRMPEACFLRRSGKRVGGGARLFLNYAHPDVRAYMHGVIDRLVAMGVGYFKNDYNECTGHGDDTLASSAAEGLIRHTRAFYSFIAEVRTRHLHLIIENCGGGAMRSDYGILAHFHLQSSSDQEIYHLYPSIIAGGLANILPEQFGIWVYPYPHLFLEKDNEGIFDTEAYRNAMADGEQTIFNVISGLCGTFYLSGRIDKADARNMALLQEGIALYRKERPQIHESHPCWPLGMNRINEHTTWTSVGLLDETENRMLLAVWRRSSHEERMVLPLPGWVGRQALVRQIYPSAAEYQIPVQYHSGTGTLALTLPKTNMARYFEVIAM